MTLASSTARGRAALFPLAIFVATVVFALLNAARYTRHVTPAFYENSTDLTTYLRAREGVRRGGVPYRDFRFEYPPTAAYYLALPNLKPEPSRPDYLRSLIFLNAAVCGSALGWILTRIRRWGWRPFAMAASLGGAAFFTDEILFARFDGPIAFGVAAVLVTLLTNESLSRREFGTGGVLLGLLAGLKVFPIVLVGPLLARRFRRSSALGLLGGLLPTVALAMIAGPAALEFLSYHSQRHLEFGSLYATIARLYEPCRMVVEFGAAECRVPDERVYLVASTLLTLVATVVPFVLSLRTRSALGSLWWGAVALYGFILFNKVGSPQYVLWPLAAALPLVADRSRRSVPLVLAVVLALAVARLLMTRYDTMNGTDVASRWALFKNAALTLGYGAALCGAISIGRDPGVAPGSDQRAPETSPTT